MPKLVNKFLVDENLSPKIASYLKDLGYVSLAVRDTNLRGATDASLVDFAIRNRYTIVTQDLDFGQLFHFQTNFRLSAIVIRSKFQSLTETWETIRMLHTSGILRRKLKRTLIVASKNDIRVRRPQG